MAPFLSILQLRSPPGRRDEAIAQFQDNRVLETCRDAVPGFLREFWAKVDTKGTYRGQCSELCGKEHGYMPVVVHVVDQEEFDTWLKNKKAELAAANKS